MTPQELENSHISETLAKLENDNISFIVPARNYDICNDERLLIPFVKGVKIGFINRLGEIVIEPKFDVVRGNCISEQDFIHVGFNYSYAFERKNGEPVTYNRTKWGIINSTGSYVLEPQYSAIVINENSLTVRRAYGHNYDGSYALLSMNGETIIPFGIYKDIEPFVNGLARCRNYRQEGEKRIEMCGVINEDGDVVLECIDRHIMQFYGKYSERYLSNLKEILWKENKKYAEIYFPRTIEDMADTISKIDNQQQELENRLVSAATAISQKEDVMNSQALYINASLEGTIKWEKNYGDVTVVSLSSGRMGVFKKDICVVPFGKYGWIDGFENGLARVRSHGQTTYTKNTIAIIGLTDNRIIEGENDIEEYVKKDFEEHPDRFAKWGIINEDGEEVLPVIYDEVWNFFGKGRSNTKAVRDGVEISVSLRELRKGECQSENINDDCDEDDYNEYGTHYGEYSGTYAQDVAGYSDDVINDAFDGEPEAYWNID